MTWIIVFFVLISGVSITLNCLALENQETSEFSHSEDIADLMVIKQIESDEHRNEIKLHEIMLYLFPYHLKTKKRPLHLLYEINDGRYCGVLGFLDIQYNYRTNVFMKIWEKGFYDLRFARELTKLTDIVMNEFNLQRIGAETPDLDIVKMSKHAGFKVEGTQKYGFKWKFSHNIILRIVCKDSLHISD